MTAILKIIAFLTSFLLLLGSPFTAQLSWAKAPQNKRVVQPGNEFWLGDPQFGTGDTPLEKLNNAVKRVGSRNVTLHIPPGNYEIFPAGSHSYTIPSNITLAIEPGAILNPVKGKSLHINGGIQAGPYRIFGSNGTISLSCNYPQAVYPQWWGAKGDGTTDDSVALLAAMLATGGQATVMLPKGIYRICQDAAHTVNLSSNLDIEGLDGAQIKVDAAHPLTLKTIRIANPILTGDASRHRNSVTVNSTNGIQPGDLFHIFSQVEAEKSWHYKKHDMSVVKNISGSNKINLVNNLNFDYKKGENGLSIEIYRPHKLSFKNITFCPDKHGSGINLLYFRPLNFTRCKIIGKGSTAHQTGITINSCVDVFCRKMEIKNITYGIIISNTRNFLADNTNSSFCWVPYAPAQWSDNVTIRNLTGYNNTVTMDSHPSFNVTYENVKAHDTGISNLRCAGGIIKNSYFSISNSTSEGGLFHNIRFTDPAMYDDRDFLAENVVWDTPNAPLNHAMFGAEKGRKVTLRNVTAKTIFLAIMRGETIGQALLEDCEYERLFCRNQNTLVKSPKDQDAYWDPAIKAHVIDIRKSANFRTNIKGLAKGAILKNVSGPVQGTIRIKTFVNYYPSGGQWTSGKLKLSLVGPNKIKILENDYQFRQEFSKKSTISLPFEQVNVYLSPVLREDKVSLSISNIAQNKIAMNENLDDMWVQFDVDISSTKPTLRFDLNYELELNSPTSS